MSLDATRHHAASAHRRIGNVVERVDQLFPLAWIGFYLVLPVSGWSAVAFRAWFDQRRDLEALESVISSGRADEIADSGIGPAYVAVAAWIHSAFGLAPQDALVVLTRGSYVLSIAVGMVLVRLAVRRLVAAPAPVSIAAQLLFVAFAVAAGTWYWSDVPWSHFFAAFLGVTLYAVRYVSPRATLLQAAAFGVVIALLALTRSFELVAVVLAWAIVLGLLAVVRLLGPRTWNARHLCVSVATFAATVACVYLATGKRNLFFLYSNHLDYQGGTVLPVEGAETPTFSFAFVPVKLVQLFVEPCYYALCSLSDYAGAAGSRPPELAAAAGNERLWSLPLAVQLPALVLLPVCLVVLGALTVWFVRNRAVAAGRVRELRLLLEMTFAASGMVVGYAASTLTGPSHLRYGFARDFLLPALLTAVVAVTLIVAGLWLVLARRGSGSPSPEFALAALCVFVSGAVVLGVAQARAHGIPRIESKQIESVAYTARCGAGACAVSIVARNRAGESLSIPDASSLVFGCRGSVPRLSVYADGLAEVVPLPATCREPRLVAAWPTVMGLPPGSFELAAVSVENA
jgi:hypothetical protein